MAILQIPVKGSKETIELDTDNLPEEMFREAVLQGLKQMVNRNMSKITKAAYPVEAERQNATVAKARENAEAIKANDTKKIKLSGKAKASKASGEVQTEAMRLARQMVKDAAKAAGMKVSLIKASEITAAAKEILGSDAGTEVYAKAQANIDARSASPKLALDIKALVKEDATLAAKAKAESEAKKAETAAKNANKPLSAKQAGMPAKSKPKAQPQASA